ncbi:stabilizer of axonemal microtubules 2 [Spea bombifrons]|uniref:stabilizer of axonemal microtubules 2 n=1 Tax=Spea bombifrons TaxID=233779 RepID=UPI00234AA2B3|nr:stabilizer of axonemal microtubules 2 [Spea bombifrons]
MKRKCICEICTCGRHHCPHAPTMIFEKSEKPCVLTEYVEKYPQYDLVQPPQSMKPKQEYQGNRGKIEGLTTFKSDYLPYDVVNRPVRAHEEYKPKPGHIDLETTYHKDFNPYKIQPVAPVHPVDQRKMNAGKFDANPTYKDDFRPWDIQKRELAKKERVYQPPTEKFGNSTTFQDDFFPKDLMPRESFKPSGIAKLSDIPFDGTTNHRVSYVPYELEPRFARKKQEYKPNSQPFDDLTTHRINYKGAPGEITQSYKPEAGKVGSSARFEGSTEFKDSFQPWSLPLHHVHKAEEYVPPSTHMALDTTTHTDYVPHQLNFVAPIRPVSHGRRSNVPFQGNTTMKEDFRAWETGRQQIIKKDHQIPKPCGKFEGLTTFRSHYLPHEINPTQSYKPSNMPLRSSAPFEDGTMYRSDYTPKRNEICPANYPSPPGYIFENIDNRGHRMFRKILTPEMNAFSKKNGNSAARAIAVMS